MEDDEGSSLAVSSFWDKTLDETAETLQLHLLFRTSNTWFTVLSMNVALTRSIKAPKYCKVWAFSSGS